MLSGHFSQGLVAVVVVVAVEVGLRERIIHEEKRRKKQRLKVKGERPGVSEWSVCEVRDGGVRRSVCEKAPLRAHI